MMSWNTLNKWCCIYCVNQARPSSNGSEQASGIGAVCAKQTAGWERSRRGRTLGGIPRGHRRDAEPANTITITTIALAHQHKPVGICGCAFQIKSLRKVLGKATKSVHSFRQPDKLFTGLQPAAGDQLLHHGEVEGGRGPHRLGHGHHGVRPLVYRHLLFHHVCLLQWGHFYTHEVLFSFGQLVNKTWTQLSALDIQVAVGYFLSHV